MQRNQLLSLGFFLALFLVLYLGCDTKSKEHKLGEKSRVQNFERINIDRLLRDGRPALPVDAKTALMDMEQVLSRAETDSLKVKTMKSMASLWYANKQPLISGFYAEKIAEVETTAQAWNIAGTTYSLAAKQLKDENERLHAIDKSREALENALSIDPASVDSKINLALTYVDAHLEDNPMKGNLMLVQLNKEQPENVPVLMQLGRLSLKTGQIDKAVARLTKVIELRPSFRQAHCLLAEVYQKKGDTGLAQKEQNICDTLK